MPRRAGRGRHNRQPPVFVTGYLNVRCQSPRTSYAAAGAPRIMGTAAGPRRAPRSGPPTCSFVRPPPRPAARYYPHADTRTPDGRPAPGFGRHRANKTRGEPQSPARSPRVPVRSHGDASPKPPQLWGRGPAAAAARSHRVPGAGTAPGATRPRGEGRLGRWGRGHCPPAGTGRGVPAASPRPVVAAAVPRPAARRRLPAVEPVLADVALDHEATHIVGLPTHAVHGGGGGRRRSGHL